MEWTFSIYVALARRRTDGLMEVHIATCAHRMEVPHHHSDSSRTAGSFHLEKQENAVLEWTSLCYKSHLGSHTSQPGDDGMEMTQLWRDFMSVSTATLCCTWYSWRDSLSWGEFAP